MAIVTVQKPDSLSMSGNLKELVLQSVDPVSVVLRAAGAIVLEETFYPGNGNLIHIGLTEVVKSHLSFTLPSSDVFIQPNLSKDFTVAYGEDSYTFRCIRSGKMHLNESATQFLTGNFLTWQPTQKAVTYYSPEWLTYYAPEDCTVRLRAYWEDGTNSTISLSGQSSGTCVSYNLQYAVIAGKFAGKRPMYYDVWVENPSGTRLSYVQRYVASEKQGEDENWYLFENSLGGIDSLRAYGALKDDPEYTHNLAVFGDESEEYRIDTNRLLTRNTGMLTPEEARWLQDMFVASRKYVYTLSGLYRIVFTSSNAKTDSANPPVSYSFTYRLSDGRPYLDIQRRTDLPENLVIPIPTGDTFFLPPRLAEFPKPTLSPDLLIPVQEPHTEVWGATTTGQIHDTVLNDLIRELDGLDLNPIQGEGGINVDIIKLNDLTIPSDTNVFSALRTLKEIADATDGLLVEVNDMFLRKDIDDTAHGNILFDKKIGSSIFIDGWEGKGWEIQSTGAAILDSLRVRSDIYVGGRMGSPSFISGFPEGTGWDLSPYTITNSAGVKETRYRLEIDDIVARKSARFYEMIISQLRGENDNVMFSGQMKVAYYDSAAGRLYLDTELGILYNPFRPGDLLEVQRYNGIPSSDNNYYITKQYELQVEEVGIGSLADGEDRLDWITFKNFVGNLSQIAEGDILTRVDSATDSTRKGIVKITTIDELGTPHISAIYGMKTNPDDSLLARLGNCAGVRTKNGIQLTEQVGLYARGAFFENSTIVLQNGDTIEQTFIAMNGKFESLIDSIRNDISAEGGNILVNSSFSQNTNYWTAANNVHFINVGGEYLWLDGSFYVEKDQVADIYNDNGQNVLRIRNTYILQQNAIMNIPDHTEEEEKTYSFSLFYKVLRPGSCGFGIPGTELYHEEQLPESDSYQKLSKVGKWNGKGDFELRFTGEILIYGVGLFSDEIADAIVKLQTQILQTEEEIKLWAEKEITDSEGRVYEKYDGTLSVQADQISALVTHTDNIDKSITTMGLKIDGVEESVSLVIDDVNNVTGQVSSMGLRLDNMEGDLELYVKDSDLDGNELISRINLSSTTATIQANRINLVGAVTFSMFDYSLQSTINGKANSSSLGNLAYEDYVTDSDLSYSLAQTIANKVSSSALKNFALNGGPDITKGDLANALQTEINNKLTGSATTSGNKLANVIINGQTLIAGGYIQANLINVDELYATSLAAVRGTIGGFTISGDSIVNTNAGMTIDPIGYINFAKGGKIAYLGAYTKYTKTDACVYVENTENNPIGNDGIYVKVSGGADNRALHCEYMPGDAAGREAGIRFIHFKSDTSWYYRSVIYSSQMPTETQINDYSSTGERRQVWWDSSTGYLYVK